MNTTCSESVPCVTVVLTKQGCCTVSSGCHDQDAVHLRPEWKTSRSERCEAGENSKLMLESFQKKSHTHTNTMHMWKHAFVRFTKFENSICHTHSQHVEICIWVCLGLFMTPWYCLGTHLCIVTEARRDASQWAWKLPQRVKKHHLKDVLLRRMENDGY